ncbi:MAG: S49 family peptidase [Hyphomicrobiaceae bacterium]
MWPFRSRPIVPVLRFSGPIGMATPLRPGLTLAVAAGAIEKAFSCSRLGSVAVVINSPGGSAVQSHLIFRRIRRLANERKKKVYVFCEDVAASGGYFLAVAGDEIYADPSSIVGSIGVIAAGFGFDKALTKLGIERRVYTAGECKGALDPFLPEKSEEVDRLAAIQKDVHDVFRGVVVERRRGKLAGNEAELFSGAFWSGARAVELGLIDGLSDLRTKMVELHGDKVRFRPIPIGGGGLLARLRRLPRISAPGDVTATGRAGQMRLGDDMLSTLEERALWQRYGL